jgi:rhodanese-related sulfurtransferase
MSLTRHYDDAANRGGRDFDAVLTPDSLEELLAANPRTRLLDVRTPGEYETVHIVGSYNVPLDNLGEHSQEIRSNVTDPVVLICQSGARARRAEEALLQCSMTNLHVLDGGVTGWAAANKPVARAARRMSLERQVRIVAGAMAATGGLLALAVNPLFALVPAFVGSGLVFAGVTDTCGMAMVLSRLPYNRAASCDVDAMVMALKTGAAPTGMRRMSASSPVTSCAS